MSLFYNISEDLQLSNTDEFRTAALHFNEFGVYTKYTPNPHPSSPYYKFWVEESKRCINGYHIGRDYIPGYYYWYLNYSPIWRTEEKSQVEGSTMVQADRIYDFPKVWDSDYNYYHYLDEAEKAGQHGSVLKTRGRGYSFKGGSMLARNYYHFPGSRSLVLAGEKEYLIKDGILTKAWDNLDWVDTHTPWAKKRHYVDQMMHKRASYKKYIKGVPVEHGYKSEIIGISLKDDPDKARGKRAKLILFEEAGKFPDIEHTWRVGLPSVQQGRSVYGLMVAYGTGGTEGANFEGLEKLFYRPKAYNIYPVKNIWENKENSYCGLFIPEYMNREGYMDKDGNSFKEQAIEDIIKEREIIRVNSSDPNTLTKEKAEKPITPSEAVLKTEGSPFPIGDLKEVRDEIVANPEKYLDPIWCSKFVINQEGKVTYKMSDIPPLRNRSGHVEEFNKAGCVEIFEHPVETNGEVPYGLYIAGCDPYDSDTGESLGSIFIMNTLTDRIVAEYTGRPTLAEDFYETARRLLIYYNATCNYENNIKGFFGHFSNKNSLHLLCDTPTILKDMNLIKSAGFGNSAKGTRANEEVNKWGRRLIKTWMLTQAYDKEEGVLNLHTIRSLGLLEESIYWNTDGNFDRISALGMLMIYRMQKEKTPYTEEDDDDNDINNDPFFNRHFGIDFNKSVGNMKKTL